MSFNEETLYSNNNETVNSKQIALLKKHFPQCFDKTGDFIQEKMLDIVNTNDIELSKETYSLNWLGKSYARLLTNLPPETLLTQDKTHNQLEENKNSKNLLIKGDNLEVLKHLVNAYSEKVKMIYIDPPYNTGKDDFTYQDSKSFTKEQLSELAAIDIDEAERILEFTASSSNSHSAWLTFIYPRLYIARELLKEDGVIFISIDGNELNQLKLISDEIFGESNCIATVVWKNVTDNNPTNIAIEHEYVVAFAKDKSKLESQWKSQASVIKDKLINIENKLILEFTNPKELQSAYTKWFKENKFQLGQLDRYKFIDEGGVYTGSQSVHNPGKDGYFYDVIHPVTGNACKPPLMGYRFKEETMNQLIEDDKILYGKDDEKIIELKLYAEEYEDKFSSLFEFDGRLGANELRKLFPEMKKVFTNPKPTFLLEKLISYCCNGDGIILDFFAGSGTTAQSCLTLNCQESTSYEFISVQLPELTDKKKDAYKAGYESIFEITKERIIRSANKAKSENPDYQSDLGFKIFGTIDDFRRDNTALTLDNLSFFDDEVLTDEQYQSLLTTWALYDGSLLTDEVLDIELADYKAHYCNGRLYLIAPHFTTNALKDILLKLDNVADFSPHKVVLYGSNFDSAKQRELNEAITSYANKKSLELDIVVRN